MNQVLEEYYAADEVVSRSGKTFKRVPTSIGWHKGRSLYEWMRSAVERLLAARYGSWSITPLLRFESLVYLRKTQDDRRPWHWHRDF
jgi:hypothetical protein